MANFLECLKIQLIFQLFQPYLSSFGSGIGITKEVKIGIFGRFFGDLSVFGWVGNDFGKEKSEEKKSEKNRRFFR